MGFKKISKEFSFADVVLESSKKHNRNIKNIEKLSKSIDWNRVENILMSHYTVGLSAKALTPILLCCFLNASCSKNGFVSIQILNWKIKLTTAWSFKEFLRLPLSKPSPDHSTFSRFRSRLSKKAMDQINTEILRQFESQGLTINEGIAIDERLVKSASRPISNEQIKNFRNKHNTPEGKLDKILSRYKSFK